MPGMTNTAVFLDHHEARVFHLREKGFDESTIHAPTHHVHRHPRGAEGFRNDHPDDTKRFFHGLAQALEDADHILLLGPSTAKLHFLRYLHKNDAKLERRVVGVETVDHPTDNQIAAYARRYFDPQDATVAVGHSLQATR